MDPVIDEPSPFKAAYFDMTIPQLLHASATELRCLESSSEHGWSSTCAKLPQMYVFSSDSNETETGEPQPPSPPHRRRSGRVKVQRSLSSSAAATMKRKSRAHPRSPSPSSPSPKGSVNKSKSMEWSRRRTSNPEEEYQNPVSSPTKTKEKKKKRGKNSRSDGNSSTGSKSKKGSAQNDATEESGEASSPVKTSKKVLRDQLTSPKSMPRRNPSKEAISGRENDTEVSPSHHRGRKAVQRSASTSSPFSKSHQRLPKMQKSPVKPSKHSGYDHLAPTTPRGHHSNSAFWGSRVLVDDESSLATPTTTTLSCSTSTISMFTPSPASHVNNSSFSSRITMTKYSPSPRQRSPTHSLVPPPLMMSPAPSPSPSLLSSTLKSPMSRLRKAPQVVDDPFKNDDPFQADPFNEEDSFNDPFCHVDDPFKDDDTVLKSGLGGEDKDEDEEDEDENEFVFGNFQPVPGRQDDLAVVPMLHRDKSDSFAGRRTSNGSSNGGRRASNNNSTNGRRASNGNGTSARRASNGTNSCTSFGSGGSGGSSGNSGRRHSGTTSPRRSSSWASAVATAAATAAASATTSLRDVQEEEENRGDDRNHVLRNPRRRNSNTTRRTKRQSSGSSGEKESHSGYHRVSMSASPSLETAKLIESLGLDNGKIGSNGFDAGPHPLLLRSDNARAHINNESCSRSRQQQQQHNQQQQQRQQRQALLQELLTSKERKTATAELLENLDHDNGNTGSTRFVAGPRPMLLRSDNARAHMNDEICSRSKQQQRQLEQREKQRQALLQELLTSKERKKEDRQALLQEMLATKERKKEKAIRKQRTDMLKELMMIHPEVLTRNQREMVLRELMSHDHHDGHEEESNSNSFDDHHRNVFLDELISSSRRRAGAERNLVIDDIVASTRNINTGSLHNRSHHGGGCAAERHPCPPRSSRRGRPLIDGDQRKRLSALSSSRHAVTDAGADDERHEDSDNREQDQGLQMDSGPSLMTRMHWPVREDVPSNCGSRGDDEDSFLADRNNKDDDTFGDGSTFAPFHENGTKEEWLHFH